MKVTMPNLGNLASIAGKSLLSNLGHEVILPPPNTKRTLDLGVRYAPEYCPLKIVLGNFIEAIEKGADTIITVGGWGPCRFGYYSEIQRKILKSLGYRFKMISLEVPRGNLIRMLRYVNLLRNKHSLSSFIEAGKIAWSKILAIEELEKEALRIRPRENIKRETSNILKHGLLLIDDANSVKEIEEVRQKIFKDYNKIIKGNENKDVIKVKLVGEFYVALEPFVNHNIEEKLGYLGVEVERAVSIKPWITSVFNLNFLKGKHKQESLIEKAADPYLPLSVGGEGQSTVGNIVLASGKGADCMPEIVAEIISKKVSDDLNFPVLTLIYDEQTGEEGLNTRLEAFIDLLKSKKLNRHLVRV